MSAELRSRAWFGRTDMEGFANRSWGCDFDFLRGATPPGARTEVQGT
jgi:hypothetical protein